jgi:lysophospholipase L1-like esterase
MFHAKLSHLNVGRQNYLGEAVMFTSKKAHSTTLVWCLNLVTAFVLALLAWELILGQLILQKPTSQTHGELGRIYGRGLYVQGKEGYGRTLLNELGLRSPSLTEEPFQKDERNILVLGDSYTQAMQVSDEVAFPQHLNELLGEHTNVINAGREGASPADYIALAEYNHKTFDPDAVVVQLNEADFTRDLLSDKQTFYFEATARGFTLRENKSVVSSNELASRFANLQGVLNFSVMRLALERVEAMRAGKTHIANETLQVGVQETDGSLEKFVVQELKRAYQNPVLLYIPEIDYFSPDYAQPHPTEKHLAEAARNEGLRFISLRGDFVALYRHRHRTAHGFTNTQPGMGHINPLGHEVAAERLAQELTPQVANAKTSSGSSRMNQ